MQHRGWRTPDDSKRVDAGAERSHAEGRSRARRAALRVRNDGEEGRAQGVCDCDRGGGGSAGGGHGPAAFRHRPAAPDGQSQRGRPHPPSRDRDVVRPAGDPQAAVDRHARPARQRSPRRRRKEVRSRPRRPGGAGVRGHLLRRSRARAKRPGERLRVQDSTRRGGRQRPRRGFRPSSGEQAARRRVDQRIPASADRSSQDVSEDPRGRLG